jgi:hypothetical protein
MKWLLILIVERKIDKRTTKRRLPLQIDIALSNQSPDLFT